MNENHPEQATIVRTMWGLSIAGTRITLYDVMDYLAADWPRALIQSWLNLSDQQMTDALEYIETYRSEIEAEYQQVLQHAEEVREYWDNRNRERLAQIASLPPKPGQEHIRAKLQGWKTTLAEVA